jgi:hypothetical protein
MTPDEVVKVLARIQMDDNRQVDRVVVQSWVEEIGDLDFTDALEAVILHRKTTTEWLMAAHVRQNVRLIQAERARLERVSRPRRVERRVITLDRAAFDAETEKWVEYWRARRAEQAPQVGGDA